MFEGNHTLMKDAIAVLVCDVFRRCHSPVDLDTLIDMTNTALPDLPCLEIRKPKDKFVVPTFKPLV
jgi:hypothetical protein